MGTIAVITARGGSKRIPKKNIRDFCGKPIIAYGIEAAKNSGLFETVMVSTDSTEIAEIAQYYGAEVPFFRSESTSNDYSTTEDVLKEVLECYLQRGITFTEMCCIYPTAPFVTAEKLQQAYQMLLADDVDSVIPVVKFSFPPQRGMIMKNGMLEYMYPEYMNTRSQDLEPVYHDCGQFYFYKIKDGLEFTNGNYAPIIVPEIEVQDIDTFEDWKIAELKYCSIKTGEPNV